jgi:hypothetical protein
MPSKKSARRRREEEEEEEEGPEPPAWGTSHAKELLLDDIRAGIWKRGDPPAAVRLSRPEFEAYKLKKFGPNFRAACDQLSEAQARAKADAAAIANDRQIHPRSALTVHGYPQWDGSTASLLLIQDLKDIEEGRLAIMKPKALRELRDEYLAFPLDVFRKHIHQNHRIQVEGAYWQAYWRQQKLTKQGLL